MNVPVFTMPRFPVEEVDGHFLSIVASGLVDAGANFRAPYEGGAAFLLEDSFPRQVGTPAARIAQVLPQVISALEISDHQLALTSYSIHYGLETDAQGKTLVARQEKKPVFKATFDDANRLVKLDAELELLSK